MATPSKQPKLTYEILTEQSKEKEINDLKNQLKNQKVENQVLLDGMLDLKNQLACQKEKLLEKDEALKINRENIAELKSQRDKIQEKYDLLKHPLDHLPDEVQLNIFKFLDLDDVIRCAHVSKRTRRICHDESIWKKVNISGKAVPSEFIEQILENGCQYINLRGTKIFGGLNLPRNDYDVKYLNLSWCKADKGVLEKLVSSCQSLQKIALAKLDPIVAFNVLKSLNPQHLQTLDLNAVEGLDLELMKSLLSCKTLTEISLFGNGYLSNDCVQYLVENLSSGIKEICLSGIQNLTDERVKILVSRCKKIEKLQLLGCESITEDSLTSIVEYSKQLVELDVSGRKIALLPAQQIFRHLNVKSMPMLKVLLTQSYGTQSVQETENLRKLMPHLDINNHFLINEGIHLGIAHPGVERFKPKGGLWDIIVNEGLKLFPEKSYDSRIRWHRGW